MKMDGKYEMKTENFSVKSVLPYFNEINPSRMDVFLITHSHFMQDEWSVWR